MNDETENIHASSCDADAAAASPADPDGQSQRIAELEDMLIRARADYQNLQRRAAQESAERVRFANAELMRALIEVLDDLERALAAPGGEQDTGPLRSGVEMIYAKLLKTLATHGMENIPAQDQPFDPSVHEALMRLPSAEHEPGMVVRELEKGYRLRERVLRPARVVVSAPAE